MSYFSSSEPNAHKKTQLQREECAEEFEDFLSIGFPAAKGTKTPCKWGSDFDEQAPADEIMNASAGTNVNVISEELGEAGAVYTLQEMLKSLGLNYTDTNLIVFNGANTFNMVYFDKPPPKATRAVIIEAKGGNSQLGTRQDPFTGATVSQGTEEYMDVIIKILASHKDPTKSAVGKQLQKLASAANEDVLYLGVQTKYDKKNQVVFLPVCIFTVLI